MELDELKKSWNAIDKRLQQTNITDEEQIGRLIQAYKAKTDKSIGHLTTLQRFSLGCGLVMAVGCVAAGILLPSQLGIGPVMLQKIWVCLLFIAVSLLAGGWWDWKLYHQLKQIRIDEMSVAEVSRWMLTFRRQTKYEVVAICVWSLFLIALNYWVMDYQQLPAGKQMVLMACYLAFTAVVVFIVYKRLVYRHLNDIKKNIEELKEICTE